MWKITNKIRYGIDMHNIFKYFCSKIIWWEKMYKNRKNILKTCRYLMTIARRSGAKKVVAKIRIDDGKNDQADFFEIMLPPDSMGDDLEKQILEKIRKTKESKVVNIRYVENKRTEDEENTWYFFFELTKEG